MNQPETSSLALSATAELDARQKPLKAFFHKLKTIRNLSLGIGALGTGVMVGSAYKPIGVVGMSITATVTTLALSTAATAQVLLSLNEQLEVLLNQPAKKPDPASFAS